jgi:hypothetical protein
MDVQYDGGPSDADADDYRWTAATFNWYGNRVVGMRWNGHAKGMIGNPQSRGNPTWFIVPDELADAILREIEKNSGQWPTRENS